jgi:hypothetical protein
VAGNHGGNTKNKKMPQQINKPGGDSLVLFVKRDYQQWHLKKTGISITKSWRLTDGQ